MGVIVKVRELFGKVRYICENEKEYLNLSRIINFLLLQKKSIVGENVEFNDKNKQITVLTSKLKGKNISDDELRNVQIYLAKYGVYILNPQTSDIIKLPDGEYQIMRLDKVRLIRSVKIVEKYVESIKKSG